MLSAAFPQPERWVLAGLWGPLSCDDARTGCETGTRQINCQVQRKSGFIVPGVPYHINHFVRTTYTPGDLADACVERLRVYLSVSDGLELCFSGLEYKTLIGDGFGRERLNG